MKKKKKSNSANGFGVNMERITVNIDICAKTRQIKVKHPAFGVDGYANTEPDLRYLLSELNFHLGEYIWDRMNPWNGEDDDS